jgi:hypothetical protein
MSNAHGGRSTKVPLHLAQLWPEAGKPSGSFSILGNNIIAKTNEKS